MEREHFHFNILDLWLLAGGCDRFMRWTVAKLICVVICIPAAGSLSYLLHVLFQRPLTFSPMVAWTIGNGKFEACAVSSAASSLKIGKWYGFYEISNFFLSILLCFMNRNCSHPIFILGQLSLTHLDIQSARNCSHAAIGDCWSNADSSKEVKPLIAIWKVKNKFPCKI